MWSDPKFRYKLKGKDKMKKIAVIGAGSWGTALALTLGRNGHQVRIWDVNEEHLKALQTERVNNRYLPGCPFEGDMEAVLDIKEAIEGAYLVLFVAPTQHFRSALHSALPYLTEDQILVNAAKGIEQKTLKTVSQILAEELPNAKYAMLSGPSHAEEVGISMPTTVAAASKDPEVAKAVQDVFMNDYFRIYTNDDVLGTELGGAMKNIIALGAGISDGMGFGDNTKAALMTRGIVEIIRLGKAMGASADTFSGLAGMGDLIVTCISDHSRNRRCGLMIGAGEDPKIATEKVGMVVEGMYTTEAAHELAKKLGVEMPITEAIYEVINGRIGAREALDILMMRKRGAEKRD